MSRKMSGASSLVQSLESAGVDVMFGIPGVQFFLPTIQSLIAVSDISWFDMNKVPDMQQLVMRK
jgi:Thiamine pyrophosphate-requiring enzymes [acetolactate synthase, pyruvate dehydrogenase (cytochrome), glyoxylate carboligase, phosphonopyruvate decarboxylase]